MTRELVAVYGTLKRTFGNNRLLNNPYSTFVATALSDDEYVLRESGFPLACKQGREDLFARVHCELFEVTSAEVIQNMDWLESNGSFYTREQRSFTDSEGNQHTAWIYLIPEQDHRGLPLCPKDTEGNYYWRTNPNETVSD